MSNSMRRSARSLIGAALVVTSATLSACLQSTAPQASVQNLNGSWTYTGTQFAPVRENLSGTLNVSRESGISFQGSLDLVGVNAQTQMSRVFPRGSVSGSAPGSNVIDFDASVETTPRRHVGQIVADTIAGTWVGSEPDGSMSSGTFRLERIK